VGSNVNLAGRVESFTTGGQVLIAEDTRTKIETPLRIDGEFQVEPKGAARSLRLFEIGSIGAPYALSLPIRTMPLRPLPDALPVQFTVLEEKFSGRTVYEGRLTELSVFEVRPKSSLAQAVLSNLKITVAPGPPGNPAAEIYGKVVSAGAGDASLATVRFTSTSPELKAWVQQWVSARGHLAELTSMILC